MRRRKEGEEGKEEVVEEEEQEVIPQEEEKEISRRLRGFAGKSSIHPRMDVKRGPFSAGEEEEKVEEIKDAVDRPSSSKEKAEGEQQN